MKTRFYVGSNEVFNVTNPKRPAYAVETLEEAVELAKAKLMAEPSKEFVTVVEVVKVVRRVAPPVIVENAKDVELPIPW